MSCFRDFQTPVFKQQDTENPAHELACARACVCVCVGGGGGGRLRVCSDVAAVGGRERGGAAGGAHSP